MRGYTFERSICRLACCTECPFKVSPPSYCSACYDGFYSVHLKILHITKSINVTSAVMNTMFARRSDANIRSQCTWSIYSELLRLIVCITIKATWGLLWSPLLLCFCFGFLTTVTVQSAEVIESQCSDLSNSWSCGHADHWLLCIPHVYGKVRSYEADFCMMYCIEVRLLFASKKFVN